MNSETQKTILILIISALTLAIVLIVLRNNFVGVLT
jgi:hypothetical protein